MGDHQNPPALLPFRQLCQTTGNPVVHLTLRLAAGNLKIRPVLTKRRHFVRIAALDLPEREADPVAEIPLPQFRERNDRRTGSNNPCGPHRPAEIARINRVEMHRLQPLRQPGGLRQPGFVQRNIVLPLHDVPAVRSRLSVADNIKFRSVHHKKTPSG